MERPSLYNMSALKRALIEATGPGRPWTRRGLSLATGRGPDVIRNILSGKSRNPELGTVKALAEQLKRPLSDFLNDIPLDVEADATEELQVLGTVEAGVWREVDESAAHSDITILAPPVRGMPRAKRFSLEVRGYSMDEVFRPGEFLDCLDIFANRFPPQSGDYVVVERIRGDMRETTVKELVESEDGEWSLKPRSTRPEFQDAIPIGTPERGHFGDDETRVIAIVLGSYLPVKTRRHLK